MIFMTTLGCILGSVAWTCLKVYYPETNIWIRLYVSLSIAFLVILLGVIDERNEEVIKLEDKVNRKNTKGFESQAIIQRMTRFLEIFIPFSVQSASVEQVLRRQAELCEKASQVVISLQTGGLQGAGFDNKNDFDVCYQRVKQDFQFHQERYYDLYELAKAMNHRFAGDRSWKRFISTPLAEKT